MLTFQKALEDAENYNKKHLILGNGFSIALFPGIFLYGSLFKEADFSENPNLIHVFEALGTQDFELAIRALEDGSKVYPIYAKDSDDVAVSMMADAAALKDILITTIAKRHPQSPIDISEDQFQACRAFLSNFLGPKAGHVFTFNYDLLLYWVLMHSDPIEGYESIDLSRNDGFGNDEDEPEADFVVWRGETGARDACFHYLHGALHLFDAGATLQKYTWVRKQERLIEQVRRAMQDDKFPLFVAEGTSNQKKRKIAHNSYLYQVGKTLASNANMVSHCFFLHGHSLAENDAHVLRRLARGRFKKMYIGLHGDPNSNSNSEIVKRARGMQAERIDRYPLEVEFYDSDSAHVWG
ncbi:DUF4917 family protein [Sulfitobacter sp. 20_GPM-1509m]|uniref:DUF4917 family protein n=1 Tax=Sulfitobacter sp. 20_GPM-1509m TaxID=1380367 RepID=UPI0009DE9DF2|nr:DUF4917 family protein [Sulfitobacter sp. 20_GPM-1509m]